MSLQNYTVTRVFSPEQLVPKHTLADVGEKEMQREFADWFRSAHFCKHEINGWTVTVTVNTDESEAIAVARVNQWLGNVPNETMSAFA